MLTTRQDAAHRVAWVVASARSGAGSALLVTGDPGSGKTTLIDTSLGRAGDATVLRATGVQVEAGLPHSALHALLRPLDAKLAELPDVQQDALRVALGLEAGSAPSPFILGAATLTLLAAAADDAPVLVVVDDAQWVDPASLAAVAFAARRLAGERVGALFAARTAEVPSSLSGLEICQLAPLSDAEAAELLHDRDVSPEVAQELTQHASGNLLALVELADALNDAQRSGRSPLLTAHSASVFAGRAVALPAPALDAAALAALGGDVPAAVVADAARALGLGPAALHPAEEARLLTSAADGVQWRHPTARQAVIDASRPERLRALSAALAVAAEAAGASCSTVTELRVAAADSPDEGLASALERAALEADAAGDHARASTRWARSADVGTDLAQRPRRLLEAAESSLRSGRFTDARARYDAALAAGLDDPAAAKAQLALGRIEHLAGSPRLAIDHFRRAASAASSVRVRAYAEGVLAAMYASLHDVARELAELAHDAHDPGSPAERVLVLHALGVARWLDGDVAGARGSLRSAVETAAAHDVLASDPDLLLWVVTAPLFCDADPDLGADIAAPALDRLRLRGDLLWLPRVLRLWGVRHVSAGRMRSALAIAEEAAELSRASGQTTQLVDALGLLASLEAIRGNRAACLAHADELDALSAVVAVPFLAATTWQVRGLLLLGLGEAGAAVDPLRRAVELAETPQGRSDAVADLVEALLLAGRPDEARTAMVIAPSARAAALLEPDDGVAVDLLLTNATEEVQDQFGAARCRLLAGERLRRAGLRREARTHLRAALDVFARSGAGPWRARAEEELRASGETLTSAYTHEELTGAEIRVAALVAEGRPSREVAALLFLSPKTVEFHLGRIYRKLGVRGRVELARRVADLGSRPSADR